MNIPFKRSKGHAMLTVMMLILVASLVGLNSARSAILELTMAQAYHRSASQMQDLESALRHVQTQTISNDDLEQGITPDWQTDNPSWNISIPYDSRNNVLIEYIGNWEIDADPGIPAQQQHLFRLTASRIDTESIRSTQLSVVVAKTGNWVRRLSWKRTG